MNCMKGTGKLSVLPTSAVKQKKNVITEARALYIILSTYILPMHITTA
jgi:hypothetical protein